MFATALLDEFINEAIRFYGRQLPEEATSTITVVADQASYALPARWLVVTRVEQPQYQVRQLIPGSRTSPGTSPTDLIDFQDSVRSAGVWGYRVFAGNLILDPIPTAIGSSEDIRLEYLRLYAEPAVDADTLATPANDDDVLIWLAAAAAMNWVAGDESKRVRYQEQGRALSPGGLARRYQERALAAIETRQRRLKTSTLERV